MKIAIVVQRYGAAINGGAELHARYIAERLAPHMQVEVLTTCAIDYITWRNDMPAGLETVTGIPVRRFPVSRERDPDDFGRHSRRVFQQAHALRDELAWLDAEGPTSPALVTYIAEHEGDYDFFVFFSFRYYHSYHGIRRVAGKSILVPTAERDGALGLAMFGPIFRGVRALMYNSFEERALIHAVAGNRNVPGVIVGVGSEIPEQLSPARFRHKFDMRDRFAIYVGRIDENKGCGELFDYFQRYSRMVADGMHLMLIGNPILPIPDHPKIRHLGFVSDQDKFDAMAAAELLIMPSYFESLSMVALEAWALGKPVLANGRCDVLKGQCIRSNAGLYYEGFEEFIETLRAIDLNRSLALALGRNGREYFRRHYTWPVVERKYIEMLDRLKRDKAAAALEPMPGWWAQRRNDLPPADEVVRQLPSGPAVDQGPSAQPSLASAGAQVTAPRPPARLEGPHARAQTPAGRDPRPAGSPPATGPRRPDPRGAQSSGGRDARDRGGRHPGARPRPPGARPPQGDRPQGGRPPGEGSRPPGNGEQRTRQADRGPQRRRRPGGRPPRRSGNR